MHSWEVICIEVDEDSEFNDCRAITKIGYAAPSLKKSSSDSIGAKIKQGHSRYHIEIDGTRHALQAARDPEVHFYARVEDTDSPTDPLLTLPSCSTYELDNKLSKF